MADVLISGSITYDILLPVNDSFRRLIDQRASDALSVGYNVEFLSVGFGGPAANMSFHLGRLGVNALPIACAGGDFAPYESWLTHNQVDQSLLLHIADAMTARVFISTDTEQNQLLGYFPGAMAHSGRCKVRQLGARLAVAGPDDRQTIITRIEQFRQFDLPILFDPGQAVTSLGKAQLEYALNAARWLIVNEFERGYIESLLGKPITEAGANLEAIIVTLGAAGSELISHGLSRQVPAKFVDTPLDPTGCGDAFRAGLIAGMLEGKSLEEAMYLGSDAAAQNLQRRGAQGRLLDATEMIGLV